MFQQVYLTNIHVGKTLNDIKKAAFGPLYVFYFLLSLSIDCFHPR